MTTTTRPDTRRTVQPAARLTGLAGWSLILIAVLHIAFFIPQAPWADWFDGSLRSSEPDPESVAVFWALPGGIAVPAILAGTFMIRLARRGHRAGAGVAATLIAWVTGCLWLVGPSGFIFVYATAALLLAGTLLDRRTTNT